MGVYLPKVSVRDLALATPFVIAVSGFAQAACYNSGQQLPADTVAQFTADPAQLQSKYPNGGARMVSMVRDLVASDSAMLPLVLDLSANSNADQINAIGAGLGQAALVCSRGDPTFANEIHQMVAAINNQPLALTFAAVIADSPRVAARPDAKAPGAIGFAATPTAATGSAGFAGPSINSVIGPLPSTTSSTVATTSSAGGTGGTTSSTGAAGPTGVIGGTTSSIGAAGPTGVIGGTASSTGAAGPTAVIGGTAPSTGATGPTGVIGGTAPSTGATGPTGVIGVSALGSNTGATGPAGQLGTGPTGATGVATNTGPIGAAVAGATGSPVPSGATASLRTTPTGGTVAGTLSLQTAVSITPGSFFTLNFNARTTNTSATWRSVSPSQ
jgi:hypothetical protein